MRGQIRRRDVLAGIGATVATAALAGCSSSGDGGGNGGDETVDAPTEVADYLSDANEYDGLHDMTGESEPTVMVGAGDNDFAFDPAAIKVSAGTTVTWEWTGAGGGHNVVHDDGAFTSGEEYVSDEGHTYQYTFEDAGNYLYYCQPHQSSGMLGAIVVE